MKKLIINSIFLFFLCVSLVNAQIVRLSNSRDNTIINGIIYDSKTNEKIPFAHIVDVNKGTGTISNGLGVFQIYYDGKSLQQLFAIDHLNFEEYLLPVKIAIDNTLFCEDISENKQSISYYVITKRSPEKKLLRIIGEVENEQTVTAIKKILKDLYRTPPTNEAIFLKDENNNYIYDKYGNRALDAIVLALKDSFGSGKILGYEIQRQILYKPVYSTLLNINENIFLLNFSMDKIETFNKYGQFTSEVPISFHKDKD